MMAYPSLEQYNEAFQVHSMSLGDAELKSGSVSTTGLGLPLAISGGFALTYTIKSGQKKFAVRCFHRESKALERRYSAISHRLASLKSPYFLDFQFQPQGIKVKGVGYPIVKMAWAKGETLGEFLEANRTIPTAVSKLSDALVSLAAFLEKERLAHGDIQTGNLMVSDGGSTVQLIDYDGMYVDEIKDIGSAELGHVNFQHPQRKSTNPFSPSLDRFSLIALFIALKALRLDQSVWQKTNSEVDAIIFRANDFADPGSSQVFALLSGIQSLSTDVKNFASICKSPMDKVPSLSDFLAGIGIPVKSIALEGTDKPNVQKAGYISAYKVLSATDYQACLTHVGDKVEVIGRITDVKENRARNGKPYIFINFGDWRGRIFKVSIWSEGLAALKSHPDQSWVGKWLCVVGLMEPPYVSPTFNYSHLSINITAIGQISVVSQSDAQWRLTAPTAVIPSFSNLSNQDALDRIKGKVPSRPVHPPISVVTASTISNRAVLDKIKSTNQSTHVTPTSTPQQGRRPPTIQPVQPNYRHDPPQPREKNVIEKFFGWLFG